MAVAAINAAEAVHRFVNSKLFWIADVSFFAGMNIALSTPEKSTWVLNRFNQVYGLVLDNKQSDDLLRHANRFSPHVVYQFARICFAVSTIFTALSFSQRPALVNLLYFFYSFSTAGFTLHDVLLHDDRKLWTASAKRHHILYPFMDERQVFAQNMGKTEAERQTVKLRNELTVEIVLFAISLLGTIILVKIFPIELGYLVMPGFAWQGVKLFNLLTDYLSIWLFNNRWPHIFGDNLQVILDKTAKHDPYGRQYQYFLNWNVPLEQFLHKELFKRLRGMNISVGEVKGAMILARGFLTTTLLYLLNIIKPETIAVMYVYYCLHALFAWFHHNKDDYGDLSILRWFYAVPEIILSSCLFYRPLWLDIAEYKGIRDSFS